MAGNSAEPGRSVTSKLAAIVTAFTAGSAHTLSELAGQTGLAVSTVHRLLTDLVAAQLLERGEGGEYRATRALRGLCTEAPAPTLRERAPFVVDDLAGALRATARLGVLDQLEVAYIEKEPGSVPGTCFPNAGRLPLHATALGKALLAFAGPLLVQLALAGLPARYTPHTLTRSEQLQHALHRTRVNGFAVCGGELDAATCAVAVPVFDGRGAPVAALEVQVDDLAPRTVSGVLPALVLAGRSLGRELAPGRRPRRSTRPIRLAEALVPRAGSGGASAG